MSDEVNQIQPEELVEPTSPIDPSIPISDDPANESNAEVAPVEVTPAIEEAPVESDAAPVVQEQAPVEMPPAPVESNPEPFKMRAGVNCVVDGGQVKPL